MFQYSFTERTVPVSVPGKRFRRFRFRVRFRRKRFRRFRFPVPVRFLGHPVVWGLVAQCSATPASVAATPPCSATPFQRQLDVRHSWQAKGDRCDRAFEGGCSAILLLHLKKTQDSEEICCDTYSVTRVHACATMVWGPKKSFNSKELSEDFPRIF